MARLSAYLNFNGNCAQAFDFYKTVFGKEFCAVLRFGEMPENPHFPIKEEDKNKIMHVALMLNETTVLMGSDTVEGFGPKTVFGSSTAMVLQTRNTDEARDLYDKLSKNALHIHMPLGEQFWAELYAYFQDQFGIFWMINFEGNKKDA